MPKSNAELDRKLAQLRGLLQERGLDAMLLQRVSSFAWATGGAASYVGVATTNGPSSLLVTLDDHVLVTNNIEAPRMEQEEQLTAQGWRMCVSPWYDPQRGLAELTQGLRLGADGPYPSATDLSAEMARLRARLTAQEGERFRALGRLCAEALHAAALDVRPGQTEEEIAARLAFQMQSRGVQPTLTLVATDERVFRFRHPLPTGKRLERYAMLVLGGRQRGLICSATRLVYFGPLPADLRRKAEAVARVDATLIAHSRPGRSLGEILAAGTTAYAAAGFPEEWRRHHQGGIAAYEAREYLATPGSADTVSAGQALAWNPSIEGTKSEDTVLVDEGGFEVLTAMPGWPSVDVQVGEQTIARPGILEVV